MSLRSNRMFAHGEVFPESEMESKLQTDNGGKALGYLRDRLAQEQQRIGRAITLGVSQQDFRILSTYKAALAVAEHVLVTFWNRCHAR